MRPNMECLKGVLRTAVPLALLLSSNAVPASAQSGPAATIVVAEGGNLDSLDPTLYSTTAPINLAINIGDQLVAVRDGKVVGVLAERWETPSPDNYVLHIRNGVKFHDGSDLTADDVKFTLDRIMDPATKSGLRPYISLIEEVEVVDDHTVSVKLKQPQVTFLQNLSRGIVIVSKTAFEKVGAKQFGEHPVASGPFKVLDWDHTSEWTLEANPDYWQGKPEIDRVTFRVIPEISTQVAGLLSGELDITSSVGYELAEHIASSGVAKVEAATGLFQEMIVLNTTHAPFNDVRVRQALNYAIDKDGLITSVYQGRGRATAHPFTSAVFGYDDTIAPYPYDPAKAKALLAEAGYADGFTAELIFPGGGGSTGAMSRVAEVVAGQLAAVGVKVTISSPDRVEHARQVYTEGTMRDMAVAQLINRVGDADFGIALYFDPERRAHFFKEEKLSEFARQQLAEPDANKRLTTLKQFARYLHEQAPWIYLAEVPLLYGISERLEWKVRPDQVIEIYGAKIKN